MFVGRTQDNDLPPPVKERKSFTLCGSWNLTLSDTDSQLKRHFPGQGDGGRIWPFPTIMFGELDKGAGFECMPEFTGRKAFTPKEKLASVCGSNEA